MRPIAFASALEKCRGDGGRCPPSDRIDDDLDLPGHLRSDRSPSSDFPSPSARLSVLFPDLILGAQHFDGISTLSGRESSAANLFRIRPSDRPSGSTG